MRDASGAHSEGRGPALGIVELAHIARGIVVADAMLKRAEAELFASRPVSGGKHLLMVAGEVDVVGEAMAAGRDAAADSLIDVVELALLHQPLWPFLGETVHAREWADGPVGAACIVETETVCAAIRAADAAGKICHVAFRDMQLARGLSGKAFFSMTGELSDIEAAADAARDAAGARLVRVEIIAQPAIELIGQLVFG